ncbi:D-alanine--D-alanine ligase [uncultured Ellagibacter sp.]|uniref:D-alanine--D-alanine ligase family protein n=1 Tax=uncultured Ellagibacter sp. TaxID=2137580 RepID=UPI002617C214|nr:D-alanine--D-alanine ligase [uncultured Ellagibacter sp.]
MPSAFDTSACRVALLSGGTSGEREISLASGEGALSALQEAGFPVECFDPSRKEDLKALIDGNFDVAFLCLHGRKGEDGVIQGFLETIDLPYTGPGVWSSATAINKARSKEFYRLAGVPTAPSMTLESDQKLDVDSIIGEIGPHVVVKPASEGSSIGISIVDSREALEKAIDEAFQHDSEIVVEKFVQGREFTVAVIGNDEPRALPIIEIIAQKGDFYDFESKYAAGGSKHICPAELSEEDAETIKREAIAAHKALSCEGVSRTDFILDDEGKPWALETNTIPGMTSTSLLPDAAKAAGIPFPELCTMLIQYALDRKGC